MSAKCFRQRQNARVRSPKLEDGHFHPGRQKMIENINYNGSTLAVLLHAGFREDGIHFFTPGDFSQQLGYMNRPTDYVIPPHVHNPV